MAIAVQSGKLFQRSEKRWNRTVSALIADEDDLLTVQLWTLDEKNKKGTINYYFLVCLGKAEVIIAGIINAQELKLR